MHTAITFLKQFGTQNISNAVRRTFVDFAFEMPMNLYFTPYNVGYETTDTI